MRDKERQGGTSRGIRKDKERQGETGRDREE